MPYTSKDYSPAAIREVLRTERLFKDRDRLLKRVLRTLQKHPAISRKVLDGRPAKEVLAERLATLPGAELRLLAAYVLAEDISMLRDQEPFRWFDAIQRGFTEPGQ